MEKPQVKLDAALHTHLEVLQLFGALRVELWVISVLCAALTLLCVWSEIQIEDEELSFSQPAL